MRAILVDNLISLTSDFRMASLSNSQHTFGSAASNLRKLKCILNASLVGSQESVILTNETVRFPPQYKFAFAFFACTLAQRLLICF